MGDAKKAGGGKLPNRIRELREDRKISQDKLGKMIGTRNQHVSKLETGNLRLSTMWMDKIAEALKVSPSELLNDPFGIGDDSILRVVNLVRKMSTEQREHIAQVADWMIRDEGDSK